MEFARMASALIASLRREMNGAVVADMESRGLHYERNYGVSLHTVRTAAREWAPNHDFAKYLWKQPVRELKLAAVAVADPRAVTPEEVKFWLDGVTNVELVENVASDLLSRTVLVRQIADNYVVSTNPLLVYAAILTFVKGHPADTTAVETIEFSEKIQTFTPYIERATELLLSHAVNGDEKE
jgi:3-methyladenine DNA glycosylase AlkD